MFLCWLCCRIYSVEKQVKIKVKTIASASVTVDTLPKATEEEYKLAYKLCERYDALDIAKILELK